MCTLYTRTLVIWMLLPDVINDSLNINEVATFFTTRARRLLPCNYRKFRRDAMRSLAKHGFLAARRREKLIEAPFELCTKGHEANRLDDTCVDGGGAEVSARGYGWATVKLRRKIDDEDDVETDSKRPAIERHI